MRPQTFDARGSTRDEKWARVMGVAIRMEDESGSGH